MNAARARSHCRASLNATSDIARAHIARAFNGNTIDFFACKKRLRDSHFFDRTLSSFHFPPTRKHDRIAAYRRRFALHRRRFGRLKIFLDKCAHGASRGSESCLAQANQCEVIRLHDGTAVSIEPQIRSDIDAKRVREAHRAATGHRTRGTNGRRGAPHASRRRSLHR
jgi:hypothetical protein